MNKTPITKITIKICEFDKLWLALHGSLGELPCILHTFYWIADNSRAIGFLLINPTGWEVICYDT